MAGTTKILAQAVIASTVRPIMHEASPRITHWLRQIDCPQQHTINGTTVACGFLANKRACLIILIKNTRLGCLLQGCVITELSLLRTVGPLHYSSQTETHRLVRQPMPCLPGKGTVCSCQGTSPKTPTKKGVKSSKPGLSQNP